MNTNTIRTAAAAVTGARHLRSAKNGQDAAVVLAARRDSTPQPETTASTSRPEHGISSDRTNSILGADVVSRHTSGDMQLERRFAGQGDAADVVSRHTSGDMQLERRFAGQGDAADVVSRHTSGDMQLEWRFAGQGDAADVVSRHTSGDMQLEWRFAGQGDTAVVVVCDGCSSGASSEVGARLGAALFARALLARLQTGERVACAATWAAVRADVTRALAELLERMPGDRAAALREHFLFTVVAAAASRAVGSTRVDAAVWALGDGAYSFGDHTRVLGPFADNAPPYLAYDLLGEARPAHFELASPSCGAIVIATDGAADLDGGLERFAADALVDHPDALRRHLAVLARSPERIDWEERRVVRTPAMLQDDCAIGVLRWSIA